MSCPTSSSRSRSGAPRRRVGQERRPERDRHGLAGLRRAHRIGADRDVERPVPVAERHAGHQLAQARLLLRAVGAHVAVPLVDHVVVLGVEPAGRLRVAPELVEHRVVVEAPVHVARRALVAPDVAALAVEHRLAALAASAQVVPVRARLGPGLGLVELLLPLPPRQVHVPGVEVGLDVAAGLAAGRVVLDEARRVERLREVVGRHDPRLRLGQVHLLLAGRRREQPPLLVEQHPREDRRVVEVAPQHPAEGRLPLLLHRGVGLAPRVRHVAHHQHPEAVGPVELARQLDLHVGADRVEAQPAGDQHLLAHRRVARPGVEAVGMPALVEGELEVERLAVERDVRVAEARQLRDADLAEAEVRLHPVLARSGRERQRRVVEVRILERPQPRAGAERQREARLARAGRERLSRLERGSARRRGGDA